MDLFSIVHPYLVLVVCAFGDESHQRLETAVDLDRVAAFVFLGQTKNRAGTEHLDTYVQLVFHTINVIHL